MQLTADAQAHHHPQDWAGKKCSMRAGMHTCREHLDQRRHAAIVRRQSEDVTARGHEISAKRVEIAAH